MRFYTLAGGRFAGTYNIYESREEFEKAGLGPYKIWNPKEFDTSINDGDWIEAMDGFIVQLINKKRPFKRYEENSKYQYDRQTWQYWFPMASITVIVKKGKYQANNFYALYTYPSKNSLSAVRPKDRRNFLDETQKILFATLLVTGVDPIIAYRIIDKSKRVEHDINTNQNITKKIRLLMKDEIVQSTMLSTVTPFIQLVGKKLPEEKMAEEVVQLIKKSPKGTKTHRENIMFVLGLTGLDGGVSDSGPVGGHSKEAPKAEEVPYEEVGNDDIPEKL